MSDELERRARELESLRARVIHVVGHALRTPVTTIHGLAGTIADADEARIRDVIGPALLRCTSVLERLLDDLLLAASVTTALPAGTPHASDLRASAAAAFAAIGRGRLAIGGEGEVHGLAQPGSVDRILTAILDNAARYGDGLVEVHVSREGDRAVVVIASGGPALPPNELQLAFEPFWRSERAVMRSAGLGIGLTIARSLARHAGGDVVLAPREGGGVRAIVTLPAA
jgi:signal transduction histidine kinase